MVRQLDVMFGRQSSRQSFQIIYRQIFKWFPAKNSNYLPPKIQITCRQKFK